MDIYEEYIEYLIQLAEDSMDYGNYEEAKRLLESGLMEEPGYAKLHAKLGDLYHYNLSDLALAERHYQLAIRFKTDYEEVYEDLAALYLDNKKYKCLKYWMRKAEDVESLNKTFVYQNLGKVAEAEGDFNEAIRLYKTALMESLDNYTSGELKKHIKRNKYKRFKQRWKRQRAS